MSGTTSSISPVQGILAGTGVGTNTIKYYLYPAGQKVTDDGVTYPTKQWNAYQQKQLRAALQTYSNVANVRFKQTATIKDANFALAITPQITKDQGDPDLLGFFNFPGTENPPQLGLFNASGAGWADGPGNGLDQGGYGFITLIHELGHGMGLKHPFHGGVTNNTLFPGVRPGHSEDLGNFALDQGIYTMMAYNDGWFTAPQGPAPKGGDYGFEGTPMALDVAALQSLYGPNTNFHSGDDTYVLPDTNGPGTYYSCIWDTGGDNTIEYLGGKNAVINLNSATLTNGPGAGGYVSYVQGVYGGYTIANGVLIQNAIGGSGNDLITGNNGNDFLSAGDGANTIIGGTGTNAIVSSGTDVIATDGADAVLLNGPNAIVVSGGMDTITCGSGSYVVSAGPNAIDAVFVEAGRLLFVNGNGASTIVGGTGSVTLFGGVGGGVFEGGAAGGNLIVGGPGQSVMIGNGGGDELFSTGNAGDTLVGGGGNESLVGSASAGNDVLFAGSGNDIIDAGAGNDELFAGTGNASMTAGTGNDVFFFINGQAGGTDTIFDFNPARDQLALQGYGAGAAQVALAGASVSNGSLTLTLPDDTRVTFTGVTSLNSSSFI